MADGAAQQTAHELVAPHPARPPTGRIRAMKRAARFALGGLAVVFAASVGTTGGIAWYLRSDSYRNYCSKSLSETLVLPSEIGGVTPRSSRSRQFDDVRVFLPDRRDQVFHCRSAVYEMRPTPRDEQAYVLRLQDGECEISTRTWLREDYRHVVEAGLHPGFTPGGPDEVFFSGMDMRFIREAFQMRLDDAAGAVRFENDRIGVANVLCRKFNGHDSSEPVTLTATFSPRDTGVRIEHLELVVPRLPLGLLALGDLVGASVKTGEFAGRLTYAESDSGRLLTATGTLRDLAVREFLAPFLPGGASGVCSELDLQELRVEGKMPTRLRFRGALRDVKLGELLAPLGLSALDGAAALQIRDAELTTDGIARLSLSAECRGASLEGLTTALQFGRASGRVNLTISDLRIENNRLATLDAVVQVDDSAGEALWVDGELLKTVARRALGDSLPALPIGAGTRVAYRRLGARLEVRDEQLRVFGTHGERNRVLLSVELLGKEIAVLREPAQPFDLRPVFEDLRKKAAAAAEARWPERSIPAASQPAKE